MGKSEYKCVMPSASGKRQGARRSQRVWTEPELEAYAARYLARFDCTEQRLRTVLTRKLEASAAMAQQTLSSAAVERLIDRFTTLGYLNDKRFSERLVEALRSRGASTRAIRERLRTRGVRVELVDELLKRTADTREDDLAAAATFAKRRRLGVYRPVEQQKERYQRDLAALARAGFSFEVARRALALRVEESD